MRTVIVAVAVLLAGCGSGDTSATARAQDPANGPASVTRLHVCGGSSDGPPPSVRALSALGKPVHEEAFDLTTPVTEFRIRLLNHFELPRDRQVRVLEKTWGRGSCRLTVWFATSDRDARPVEWLRWNEGDTL